MLPHLLKQYHINPPNFGWPLKPCQRTGKNHIFFQNLFQNAQLMYLMYYVSWDFDIMNYFICPFFHSNTTTVLWLVKIFLTEFWPFYEGGWPPLPLGSMSSNFEQRLEIIFRANSYSVQIMGKDFHYSILLGISSKTS